MENIQGHVEMTELPGAIGHVGTLLCGHGAFGIYYFYGACEHSHASIHVDTFGCGWSNTGLHRNIGTCSNVVDTQTDEKMLRALTR